MTTSKSKSYSKHSKHEAYQYVLASPDISLPPTKDYLIQILVQINKLQHNIIEYSYQKVQFIIQWLSYLEKLQRILQKEEKLHFFQEIVQFVSSQKKQNKSEGISKLISKLIHFAQSILLPCNLTQKQLITILMSVLKTNERDSEKYIGLNDGGKILIRWHFFFSILQNTLGRKVFIGQTFKSPAKIIQELDQFKTFLKNVIMQVYNNQMNNFLINSLIFNTFLGLQSLQFPICSIICQALNQTIKNQFQIQFKKDSNSSYHGICSPDIVCYILQQFIKVKRISIDYENCQIKDFIEENKKLIQSRNKDALQYFFCSYCGQNLLSIKIDNQNQVANNNSFNKIFISENDQVYQLNICQICQQDCGVFTCLISIPITASWRNLSLNSNNNKFAYSSIVTQSFFLKSVSKKLQKQFPQIKGSSSYVFPKNLSINSLDQTFPKQLSTKIQYFLYQNHPVEGLLKFIQDLVAKINIMMKAKTSSFRKRVLKHINAKIIPYLFQDKANFSDQVKNYSYMPNILNVFIKQKIIKQWQILIKDNDQNVCIAALDLGSSIFKLEGHPVIIDVIKQSCYYVKSQSLIEQYIKTLQDLTQDKKILQSQNQKIQIDILECLQIILLNNSIKSNSVKLKYSILKVGRQLVSKIKNYKKTGQKQRYQNFFNQIILRSTISYQFLVKFLGLDQITFKLLTENNFNEYNMQILEQYLIYYRDQILEDENLLNSCLSRFAYKLIQNLAQLLQFSDTNINIDDSLCQTSNNFRKSYHFRMLYSVLSFHKLYFNNNICNKFQKIQLHMMQKLSNNCSPDKIPQIISFIARINNILMLNEPQRYVDSLTKVAFSNLTFEEIFDNRKLFYKYFHAAKHKFQKQKSIESQITLLMVLMHGIIQVQKIRVQKLKHESWSRIKSLKPSSKGRRSLSKLDFQDINNEQQNFLLSFLPFTFEVYTFLIKVLLKLQMDTPVQIQRQLFTIAGQFWSIYPELFSSSQTEIFNLIEKMGQNALLISLTYESMLKTIKLKNFKQKDERNIEIIAKIFKKTQKFAFQTSKNDTEMRIQFYKVIKTLLNFGSILHHQYNRYIILGVCDNNNELEEIITQILRQEYRQNISCLFFNLKDSLKFVQYQLIRNQLKENSIYNIQKINKITHLNKFLTQQIKSSKTKKIDNGYNARVSITFLKKLGEIISSQQQNGFETDPEYFFFLVRIITKVQYMSPKQFVQIYYSLQEVLNCNLMFIMSITKKYSIQETNLKELTVQDINLIRKAISIILCFEYKINMEKYYSIQTVQNMVDGHQGYKQIKTNNISLNKTLKAEQTYQSLKNNKNKLSFCFSVFYKILKDMENQYNQFEDESQTKKQKQINLIYDYQNIHHNEDQTITMMPIKKYQSKKTKVDKSTKHINNSVSKKNKKRKTVNIKNNSIESKKTKRNQQLNSVQQDDEDFRPKIKKKTKKTK